MHQAVSTEVQTAAEHRGAFTFLSRVQLVDKNGWHLGDVIHCHLWGRRLDLLLHPSNFRETLIQGGGVAESAPAAAGWEAGTHPGQVIYAHTHTPTLTSRAGLLIIMLSKGSVIWILQPVPVHRRRITPSLDPSYFMTSAFTKVFVSHVIIKISLSIFCHAFNLKGDPADPSIQSSISS